MHKLGIRIQIFKRPVTGHPAKKWFDMDDRDQWEEAWRYLYNNDALGLIKQGLVFEFESDFFKTLEFSNNEDAELNDIYLTYHYANQLSRTELDIARHFYDEEEWSGSLNDLLKFLVSRTQN